MGGAFKRGGKTKLLWKEDEVGRSKANATWSIKAS